MHARWLTVRGDSNLGRDVDGDVNGVKDVSRRYQHITPYSRGRRSSGSFEERTCYLQTPLGHDSTLQFGDEAASGARKLRLENPVP